MKQNMEMLLSDTRVKNNKKLCLGWRTLLYYHHACEYWTKHSIWLIL